MAQNSIRTLALKLYSRFNGQCEKLPPLLELLEETFVESDRSVPQVKQNLKNDCKEFKTNRSWLCGINNLWWLWLFIIFHPIILGYKMDQSIFTGHATPISRNAGASRSACGPCSGRSCGARTDPNPWDESEVFRRLNWSPLWCKKRWIWYILTEMFSLAIFL